MQAVLEQSGDAMYSNDEQIYFSLVRQVEKQLASLPAEGLAAYQLEVDPEAKSIISAGEQGDLVGALNQVVNRYFVSSVGDEAAVRLGRLYLDRYDFVSARRVLEKALKHPDLSIPKNEVLAHIALCDLFLNDLKSAQQKSQQLLESQPELRIAQLVAEKIDDIQAGNASLSSAQINQTAKWQMPLASANRYGVGLPVNDRMLSGDLVAAFQFYFNPRVLNSRIKKQTDLGWFLSGSKARGADVEDTLMPFESRMAASSKKHGWRPTGTLLFGPDEVYVKTTEEMVALKMSELPINTQESLGAVVSEQMVSWRSLWKNVFKIDSGTTVRSGIVVRFGQVVRPDRGAASKLNASTPTSISEVQTYGDTIAAQFSIHDGVLYSIEGKRKDGMRGRVSSPRQKVQYGQSFTRARDNYLVAYDATQGGKVLWSLPRQTEKDEDAVIINEDVEPAKFLEQGGLMGAPVGYQESIIAPVNQNGSIWIYAFDPNDEGATIWKSHLCDEPAAGANPWSAINVSIDGSDVLVSCGLGVVFVLDAASGQIRIARRYQRSQVFDRYLGARNWPGTKKMSFSQGWSSDTIIPFGRQLICFCSDAKAIESIDRETGKTLWKEGFDFNFVSRKIDYLLGVYDGVLYAAGPETVVAFNLKTGKLLWGGDDLLDGDVSLGKGILTPQGIFIPAGKRILQFDLRPKNPDTLIKPVRDIAVDLGGAEVGNLFSDGNRFWVHGGNRIYALEAKPE